MYLSLMFTLFGGNFNLNNLVFANSSETCNLLFCIFHMNLQQKSEKGEEDDSKECLFKLPTCSRVLFVVETLICYAIC